MTVDGATDSGDNNIYEIAGEVGNDKDITVSFKRSGTYTLYAGTGNDNEGLKNIEKLQGTATKITVNASDVVTSTVDLTLDDNFTSADTLTGLKDGARVTVSADDSFLTNGLQQATITVAAKQENATAAKNETFTVTSSAPNKLVLDKTEVTTDTNGKFKINFSIDGADTYRIFVEGDDMDFTIVVNASNTDANTIETVVNDGQKMLAGTDKEFSKNYDAKAYDLADAVQFEITDKSGNVIENTLTGEPAMGGANDADKQHDNYVNVVPAEGSSLVDADLNLVWNPAKEAYTIQYVGNDAKNDLVPGEYKVTVGLKSGDTATATFTLANYGTTQDMNITLHHGEKEVTDEVVLGENQTDLTATAKYVDENGIEIKADGNIQYGFNGQAVAANNGGVNGTGELKPANESLLGTVITVTALDESIPVMKQVELTVVDGYNEYGLEFNSDKGAVNENNKVTVSVVDENGNVAKDVNGTIFAYVDNQSNADAKVYVEGGKVTKGEGTFTIDSDKETNLKLAVVVKDNEADKSGAMYVGSLDYTVGAGDINADKLVAMTIGSSDYIVNNDVVKGDAAPYVDGNWRTMVPVRALAETFGAEVTFEDNVITIVDGDKTIVMTVGEEAYTVNDEEKTMDTVPVIGEGDRTFVPTRFVAEALGYTVTPLQDANGLTASVVFQK